MDAFETETITKLGRKVIIEYHIDDCPEDPRNWDNLGVMLCLHDRYTLGDKHKLTTGEEIIETVKKEAVVQFPLFLYDHSGIRMNTTGFAYCDSNRWDWGQVGIIYTTKELIRKNFGVKKITKKLIEQAKQSLLDEVKVYDAYISGEGYGFTVRDEDDLKEDSCWGFYSIDDTREDARNSANHILSELGPKYTQQPLPF